MKKAYIIILISNFILADNIINVNAVNKLDFQFDNQNQIIGDISIFPKLGTYLLTKRKLGSLSL